MHSFYTVQDDLLDIGRNNATVIYIFICKGKESIKFLCYRRLPKENILVCLYISILWCFVVYVGLSSFNEEKSLQIAKWL